VVKSILIPALLPDPVGDQMLAAADGVRVIYALKASERALGYRPAARLAARDAAWERARDEHLPHVHALHCLGVRGHLKVTRDLLDCAPNLEVLFIAASGIDQIDGAAAAERGIAVVNAPGANAAGVAEHALGLLLALTRRIADSDRFAHRERRAEKTRLLETMPPLSLLSGRTLGVVGLGSIGRALARRARLGFDMEVIAFDPYAPSEAGVRRVDTLDELLAQADHVSLHTPLTAATTRLIGARELALMKPTAYLINTARGAAVDTDALVAALRDGTIAGAGLDVTDPEPLPPGHRLFAGENVVLTPHVGGLSPESNRAATVTAVSGALQALNRTRGETSVHGGPAACV
jgi:phosphoglycerate dehydrogenase-like enzyme